MDSVDAGFDPSFSPAGLEEKADAPPPNALLLPLPNPPLPPLPNEFPDPNPEEEPLPPPKAPKPVGGLTGPAPKVANVEFEVGPLPPNGELEGALCCCGAPKEPNMDEVPAPGLG